MERDISGQKQKRSCDPETHVVGDSKPRGTTGRQCVTCSSPKRAEIEAALLAGKAFSVIEREITLGHPTDSAIKRHTQVCVPEIMGLRRINIQEPDRLSRAMIEQAMMEALDDARESSLRATTEEDDETGRLFEGAAGRTAAIKARFEIAKGAGEALGIIESKTKVEVVMSDPVVAEMLARIIDAIPDEYAQKVRDIITEVMG